ncbi:MAG: hypothetical protein ACP5NZ_05155 [Nanobdellota archaeon]
MIEYKLLGKNNKPLSIEEFKEVGNSINSIIPQAEESHSKYLLRKTYGTNGETIHLIYGYNGPRIILPETKYGETIKKRVKSINDKLKFERVQCQ